MNPERSDREWVIRKVKRLVHAERAFKQVIAMCKHASLHVSNPQELLYQPMMAAICVTYARPFTANNGLGPLGDNSVRPELRTIHEALMSGRNKIYGHTDIHYTMNELNQGNPVSVYQYAIEVKIDHGKVAARTVSSEPSLKKEELPDIERLCEEHLKQIEKELPSLVWEILDGKEVPGANFYVKL